MAQIHPAQAHLQTPREFDARDANFARDMALWSSRAQHEIQDLVAAGKATIAASRTLMVEADRIFGSVQGASRF